MVTAKEGRVEKLVVAMSVVAVMSDDGKGIAPLHLHLRMVLLLLVSLHMQVLLVRHL